MARSDGSDLDGGDAAPEPQKVRDDAARRADMAADLAEVTITRIVSSCNPAPEAFGRLRRGEPELGGRGFQGPLAGS